MSCRLLVCCAGLAAAVLAALSGCASNSSEPRPALTKIGSRPVVLPAQVVGNALIVAVKGGRNGPYHFLVDTGSSRTLLSPELVAEIGAKGAMSWPRQITVRSADGRTATLPTASISRLNLGGARFDDVPVLVYNCSALSDEFGVRIDGILGFSLFRQTILTLDYGHSQVVLQSVTSHLKTSGAWLPLITTDHVPVITVKLGDRPFGALIDSGRDVALSLNRAAGGPADFAFGPVAGLTVHDLVGDRRQQIGRLNGTLAVGDFAIPRPVAELTDDLSALGGGLLKFFTITFDQEGDRVNFSRESADPITVPALRSAGLSFSRTPAYWRVAGVAPGSPAEKAGVAEGDLVTKIAGEPVRQWDKERYNALLAKSDQLPLTFLQGTREVEKKLLVTALVP
jgi:hypothetical protein